MTRNTIKKMATVGLMLAGLLGMTGAIGCDDYVAAGDFYEPTVQPMDFSPYGYD
ncbi:MAG TPA: hypothetical protein VLM89_04495 [Phycisphaerae bacterium]|nr:hypothetical protein [Phycisphaerae bacterium]